MSAEHAAQERAGGPHGVKAMRLDTIRDLLECEVLAGEEWLGAEIDTVVATDAMSAVLAAPHPQALLLTGLSNIQSVRTALIAYITAILFVRGARPNEAAIQLARDKKLVLLTTRHGMFECCGVLHEHGIKGVC
jgi:predicted transcriptional regulator